MLALADRSKNGRQRSAAAGERFVDANSQLDAFCYPIDERDADDCYRFEWSAVFFDRNAFFMRRVSRLDVIKAYDLATGAVRFLN